jgi:hypothetical protein
MLDVLKIIVVQVVCLYDSGGINERQVPRRHS